MDEGSSTLDSTIFDVDLDIEEDVDACLEEFIYLSKLHMREEAYNLANSTLRRYIDFFPVFAELSAFFILSEQSDGRFDASNLVLDLHIRKISFESPEEQNYVQMVALYATGRLFDSTMAPFLGDRGIDDLALTDSESAVKSLFYEIDYTSIAQLHNVEVRLHHVRNEYNNIETTNPEQFQIVEFAINHFHKLNHAERPREATKVFEFICTYLHNLRRKHDVLSLYDYLEVGLEQHWKNPMSTDEIKDELLTKTTARTALYIALRGRVQAPWPIDGDVRIEKLEKEIERSTKSLCAMIIDSEPPLSLHQWLEQRSGLRPLPPLSRAEQLGTPKAPDVASVEFQKDDVQIFGATGRLQIHEPLGRLDIYRPEGEIHIYAPNQGVHIYGANGVLHAYEPQNKVRIYKAKDEIHAYDPKEAVHIFKAEGHIHAYEPEHDVRIYKAKGQIHAYEPVDGVRIYKAKGQIHAYEPEDGVRIYKAKGEIHAYEAERSILLHAPKDVIYLDNPDTMVLTIPQEPLPPYTTDYEVPEILLSGPFSPSPAPNISQLLRETEKDVQSILKSSHTLTEATNLGKGPYEDRGQPEDVKLGTAVARVYRSGAPPPSIPQIV